MSLETALARGIAEMATDLRLSLASPDTLRALLARYGWTADLLDDTTTATVRSAFQLGPALVRIGELAEALDGGAEPLPTAIQIIEAWRRVADAVTALAGLDPANLPFPLDQPGFVSELAEGLVEDVVLRWLERVKPGLVAVLTTVGIVQTRTVQPTERNRTAYTPRRIRWDRLGELADPVALLRAAYRWGAPEGLDHVAVLDALVRAAWAVDVPALARVPAADLLDRHYPAGAPDRDLVRELRVPLVSEGIDGDPDHLEMGLSVLPVPVPTTGSGRPDALLVSAYVVGGVGSGPPDDPDDPVDPDDEPELPPGAQLTWALTGAADTDDGLALRVEPHAVVVSASAATLAVDTSLALTGTREPPWVVLGSAGGPRVELGQLLLGARVRGTLADPELLVEVGTGPDPAPPALSLVLELGQDTGFLGRLLGAAPRRVDVGFVLRWSSKSGLTLAGSPGLAVTVPVAAGAGGLRLDSVTVGLRAADPGLRLVVAVSGSGSLGPFAVALSEVGVALEAAPAATPGERVLGDLALRFGLKPPSGVGIAINSPAVSGGGYLRVDPQTGTYAGIAELKLFGSVAVKAIGILTTRLPDGRPGFALLILITAQGFTPVQLGMGFALTGIGGLVALNRTVDADVIRGGLGSGVLDSVLFVQDPVKNADRVLRTLDQVFPIARDRLVVGPLAEISWGTPPLLTMRVAVLLDLPQPVRAVILAALTAKLPKPDAAVVELHVDAIGVLDLGKGQLALDASLHDSRILSFAISGDVALRLDWLTNPGFLLSVGGFHPGFTPPPGIRPLKRISMTLTTGETPQVRFEAYLAITPNTLQLGARASIKLAKSGFGVEGGGSFDALIQWSPFQLQVDLAAWVKITAGGSTLLSLRLTLHVTGPSPWHLTGKASFSVLFWDVGIPVDVTLGSATAGALTVETADVASLIWEAVRSPDAWQAVLPASRAPGVTVVAARPGSQRVLAHPLAEVSVRQKVAPLDLPISRLGSRLAEAGPRAYTVGLDLGPGVRRAPVTDLFAPAQFNDLPGDQALAAPSFQPMTSGWSIAPEAASSNGPSVACVAVVDTLDITDLDLPGQPGDPAVAVAAGTGAS
ncbi:MAG TPA: DUF6603 domain-containing protein [Dermatophilaceae bacterium]|nr:DUF6603 domain-containing protein [Dermatophilaceae bacterium]